MVKGGRKVGRKISVTVPPEYLDGVKGAWDLLGVTMSEFISMNIQLFYHRLQKEGLLGSDDFGKIAEVYHDFMSGARK